MAAGRKGLAAKKKRKKAKHPGDKTADRTVKKERRKGRIEAKGENRKRKRGEWQRPTKTKEIQQNGTLGEFFFFLLKM